MVDAPGKHTLTITMVDPTIVVQSVIIHDTPLPESYFGPPPMARNGTDRGSNGSTGADKAK